MEQRFLVRYVGRVQGVGFRANARRVAQDFKVKGWVKNEADGSVQMIVTGVGAEVQAFLKGIRDSGLGSYIHQEIVEPTSRTDFTDKFEVRF